MNPLLDLTLESLDAIEAPMTADDRRLLEVLTAAAIMVGIAMAIT